jgi:hypothetical protein
VSETTPAAGQESGSGESGEDEEEDADVTSADDEE